MQYPVPGTVIGVWVGPFFHVGIVTDRWIAGRPSVISNSFRRGNVAEETWDSFADGRTVHTKGYLGSLSADVVLARARSRIGERWQMSFNCEHFVRYAHGLSLESHQLQAWTLLGSALLLALMGGKGGAKGAKVGA